MLKATLSVTILILLASTEKFHNLLGGLRKIKFPVIVGILSALMYRYIFILSDEVMRTNRARNSRTPGNLRSGKLKVLGNQLATVFIRSTERSRIVYAGMVSRGFAGEFPSMSEKAIRARDIVFFCTFGVLLLYIRFMEHIHRFFQFHF
jgi:cobalt/nickel transport system permease protein